jgi:serine/threonine protein kinase
MSDDGAHAPVADGRLIGGRYRLSARIDSGRATDAVVAEGAAAEGVVAEGVGAGRVWRAVDEVTGREVAVKQLLSGTGSHSPDPRVVNRLQHEARAAARVEHPSAVAILDVVLDDGLPWIVMELVHGESLGTVLRRGPLPPAETARIGLAVLGALRAAHSVGIVHRDVKPANVLIESVTGRVVLTDFGTWHGTPAEASTAVPGAPTGSVPPIASTGPADPFDALGQDGDFLAPEQMSRPGAGPASDLWSLGVLLYVTVEGRPPFRRTTPPAPGAPEEPGVPRATEATPRTSGTTAPGTMPSDPRTPDPRTFDPRTPDPQPSSLQPSSLQPSAPRLPAYHHAGPLAPLLTRLLAREPADRPGPDEAAAVLRAVAEAEHVGREDGYNTLISAFTASDDWRSVSSRCSP